MAQRILIVEDESGLARVMRDYLERSGFDVRIAADGPAGLASFSRMRPDLVVLDLNLPGMDGLDVARQLRSKSPVPIIMVTARHEETDRIIGLELGADDYITKPFSPREMVARVRAVLRRASSEGKAAEIIRVSGFEIDLTRHRVRFSDQEIALTPTEFKLMAVMAAQPGRAFSRLQLLEATQDQAYQGYERTVDAHMKNLRAKIERDPKNPEFIQTVFGIGYRFAEE